MPEFSSAKLPFQVHKHNTLAHLIAYVRQKPIATDENNVPVMRRLFDSVDSVENYQGKHGVEQYQLFPIGSLAYKRLIAFSFPKSILDKFKQIDENNELTETQKLTNKFSLLQYSSLDTLDPSGELRKWMLEQAFILNHYLNRKMLKKNKNYAQILLDEIFPERAGSQELYQEYEYALRQDYIEGFMLYVADVYSGAEVNDVKALKTQFFSWITSNYVLHSLNIKHIIKKLDLQRQQSEVNSSSLISEQTQNEITYTISRSFDDWDYTFFSIPLYEYDNFKMLQIAEKFIELKKGIKILEDVALEKLNDINFVDPDSSWRNLLLVYLDRLDLFLYENKENTNNIHLMFNSLFPEKSNDEKFFKEYENKLRKAYFSGFIQCLIKSFPEEKRDFAATICRLIVNEAAERESRFILRQKEIKQKPAQQKEEQENISMRDPWQQLAKKLVKKADFIEEIKQKLGLSERNYTLKEIMPMINQFYKDLYQVQNDGEFLIHHYIKKYLQVNYPEEDLKQRVVYELYNVWEEKVRSELVQQLFGDLGATDETNTKISSYISSKENTLQKHHHQTADKEYRKLTRKLGRFSDRVRYNKEGWYLEAKYHAIHDVSEQIKSELHLAYEHRRLLSPRERQILKQRCLGLVDNEMKLIFRERVTKGVLHHLMKKFRQWRDNFAKLFVSATPTPKVELTDDQSITSLQTHTSEKSLSSDSASKTKQELPAKSHLRWQALEAEFEELERAAPEINKPNVSPAA